MRRLIPKLAERPQHCVTDALLVKTHPALHAFFTDGMWEDGGELIPRERGSLILWADVGQFKAKLLDRDNGYSVVVAAPLLSSVLDACEAALRDPGAGWKPDTGLAAGKKKK